MYCARINQNLHSQENESDHFHQGTQFLWKNEGNICNSCLIKKSLYGHGHVKLCVLLDITAIHKWP